MKFDKPEPNIQLLSVPVMKASRYQDKPIYFSDIIVHKDSKINSFAELRNKIFAYNDEISNSGYNMPRAHLISLNETQGYFSNLLRSGSHEESIRMVANGDADASAIDSLVLDYDLSLNNQYATQVRVIKSLGPAGIPPVIISNQLAVSIIDKIQAILLSMHTDTEGKKILDNAGVKRFEKPLDSTYDTIRKMRDMAKNVNFLRIK